MVTGHFYPYIILWRTGVGINILSANEYSCLVYLMTQLMWLDMPIAPFAVMRHLIASVLETHTQTHTREHTDLVYKTIRNRMSP